MGIFARRRQAAAKRKNNAPKPQAPQSAEAPKPEVKPAPSSGKGKKHGAN